MAYLVAHMQKIGTSGMRGIQSHIEREFDSKTNLDIDKTRSCLNYSLLDNRQRIAAYVKKTISDEVERTPRKDAVMICSFVITSSHAGMAAMNDEEQHEFFKSVLDWFAARYGLNHIAYAKVHMDENTPHLHLGVIPIRDGRLSAKSIFTPRELKAIQTELYRDVGKRFGLERGQEGSQAEHVEKLRYEAEKARGDIKVLQEKEKAIVGKIMALEDDFAGLAIDVDVLQKIKPQRTITGAIKGITVDQIESLKKMAFISLKLEKEKNQLLVENRNLKKRVSPTQDTIHKRIEMEKIKKDYEALKKVVDKLPEDTKRQIKMMLFQSRKPRRNKGLER